MKKIVKILIFFSFPIKHFLNELLTIALRASVRAFPLGLPNGVCRDDLALKPKNHPTFGIVQTNLQVRYNIVPNIRAYCSTIPNPKYYFLFQILALSLS